MHTLIKRLTTDDKVSKQVKNSLLQMLLFFQKQSLRI